MRRLLIALTVLALLALACGQAPAVAAAAVQPQVQPPDIGDRIVAVLEGEGLEYWGEDAYGQNNCGHDRCMHFGVPGGGPDGISAYVEDGKLVSVLSAFDVYGQNAGRLGDDAGAVMFEFWYMTDSELNCLWSMEPPNDQVSCDNYFGSMALDGDLLYIVIGTASTHTNTGGAA